MKERTVGEPVMNLVEQRRGGGVDGVRIRLLDEREEYMAERIRRVLNETVGRVVVVVGFGHLRNIARRVEGYREGTGYSSRLTWTLGTG